MKNFFLKIFDNHFAEHYYKSEKNLSDESIDWLRVVPFIAIHIIALTAIWIKFEWVLLAAALGFFPDY